MAERGGVVITGASTGIGEACAIGLAERGYRVFAGVRKVEDGERLKDSGGSNIVPLRIDVTDQATIDAARDVVTQDLGNEGLRGLFNNAGVSVNGPFEYVKPEDLRWQLEVNCVGQLAVTQAFLPMLRAGKGRVITTGSVGGFVATPMIGAYCMSKFAIEAFSDALRVELSPQGIHVVLLEPGGIKTPIWDKGIEDSNRLGDMPPEFHEHYGMFLAGIQKFAREEGGKAASPQVVLDALIHALEAPKPKTRYTMGSGVGQRKFLKRLPDRWRDKAFLSAFGIKPS